MKPRQPGLVIAFGSGGARALGSLGVMTVLQKHGIRPVAVAGSSMGAVIATYYGVHGETETLRAWYESKRAHNYFAYLSVPKLSTGLLGTERLTSAMDGFLQHKTFDQTCVPVRVVATNLRMGRSRVFGRGSLLPPVMASTAIPGVMPPYNIDGEWYVDGGVTNPTPIDIFPRSWSTHVLGIDFHMNVPAKMDEPGLFDNVMRSIQVGTHTAYRFHMREWSEHCTVVRPNPDATTVLRFDRAKKYIEGGEVAGQRLIRAWRRSGMLERLQAASPPTPAVAKRIPSMISSIS